MFKRLIITALLSSVAYMGTAQQRIASDKIIGRVGNEIILQSDIAASMAQGPSYTEAHLADSFQCETVYNLLAQQILIAQAQRDSVEVDAAEVEQDLDNRIQRFINEYGSKEILEARMGKSIYQIKEENRNFFRDKLIAERMQQKIISNVVITPGEVEKFYNKLNIADIPPFPAKVEVGEIVMHPKASKEMDDYAKEKLEGIRKDIVENGRSFSTLVAIYSMDPGSKDKGGEYTINKKQFDKAFVAAAFKLQQGEISPVIKSNFGYHIIQMLDKIDNDNAKVRHILIVPEITSFDVAATMAKQDSLYKELLANNITFNEAVKKYSTDSEAKMTGGMVINPNTGTYDLYIESLDPQMATSLSGLEVGQYAKPVLYMDQRGQKATRIIYLKSRTEPHTLNLMDDYSIIQEQALNEKKNNYLFKYINDKAKEYYIYVDEEHIKCDKVKNWISKK